MVGEGVDDFRCFVTLKRILVVDQEPNTHAAIGSFENRLLQQLAGAVFGEYVVLDVERTLRRANELCAQQQSFGALRQNPEARLSRMPGRLLGEQSAHTGCRWFGE